MKAFNHLPAWTLAQDPDVVRRVTFLSSDDDAAAHVAALVEQIDFALGKLAEGDLLVQARGSTWAQLIFQELDRVIARWYHGDRLRPS